MTQAEFAPFAWPLATLILGFVFMIVFRVQIVDFLKRIKSIGRDGVSTEPSTNRRSIEQQAEAPAASEVQDLMQSFDSPALLAKERMIFAELESRRLDATSGTTKVLVRHLAMTQLLLDCEFVYRLVFGSQISLLKHINMMGGGIPEAKVEEFYERVTEAYPDVFSIHQARQYTDFLIRRNLIVHQNGHFQITDFGKEFLTWMPKYGVTDSKPL